MEVKNKITLPPTALPRAPLGGVGVVVILPCCDCCLNLAFSRAFAVRLIVLPPARAGAGVSVSVTTVLELGLGLRRSETDV